MTFPTLGTERLVLRELTVADAEHVFGSFSEPEVMQFNEAFTSIGEAFALRATAAAEPGHWAAMERRR